MSLCALELKQTLLTFLLETTSLSKLAVQPLRSYLKLTYEYELHILPW